MAAARAVGLIVQELRARGFHVLLLADAAGSGRTILEREGIEHLVVDDSEALLVLLKDESPQVIITGLSQPRGLEEACDITSARLNVPLVFVEDTWGSVRVRSSGVSPNTVITIDEAARTIVHEVYPTASVIMCGGASLNPVKPSEAAVERFDRLRHDTDAKIILFSDGGPPAAPGLKLLIESLKTTKAAWRLLPNFHPKFVNAKMPDSSQTWGEYWWGIVRENLNNDQICEMPDVTGDEAAMLADVTASSFSSLLLRAASAGRTALTLWTPEAHAHLVQFVGLERTMLMMRGGFPVLTKPESLDAILNVEPPVLDLKPFDAIIGADAISDTFR